MMSQRTDVDFMGIALSEAVQAAAENEVPVGALIVLDGEILAQDHNRMLQQKNPMAHAEMLTLHTSLLRHPDKWLLNATLFVTLEPCAMCAGALVLARIRRLVFATADPKAGACGSVMNVASSDRLNHRLIVESGPYSAEASALLTGFFQERRKKV